MCPDDMGEGPTDPPVKEIPIPESGDASTEEEATTKASWFRRGSITGWLPFSADGENLRETTQKFVPYGSDGTRLQWLEQHADAYAVVISAIQPTDFECAFAAFEVSFKLSFE